MAHKKFIKLVYEYGGICTGLVLTALGLDLFLIPNRIAAGGVSGIATIGHYVFDLPVGGSMLIMNFILFLVGFYIMGKGFGIRTLVASALFSGFVDLFAWILPWDSLTDDLLIAVIFGNLLTGMGMAVVFNRNSSTGGTDIVARILNHYTQINIGKSLLLIDFIIAASAGICLKSMDIAMYSLLAVLINCVSIDLFIDSLNVSKKVLIISTKSEEIAGTAMKKLDRGATFIPVQGAFTGHTGEMLMMVVRPRQTARLREIVRKIDPDAFMMVSSVNRVLGKGFLRFSDPGSEI